MTGAVSNVTVEHRGHVAFVEMHRPPHNYFDLDTLAELAAALGSLGAASGCRAAVLCSEGRNFCAGAELGDDAAVLDETQRLYAIAARLATTPVPTVAAVQGAAVGGGLGLCLVADFRVANARTRFACNFARLGIHHGFGMTVTLPAVVGQQRALELLYTGRDVRGDEALAIGLVDRLAGDDDVRAAAFALATEIATAGPLAVAAIRATVRGDLAARIRVVTDHEAAEQLRLRATDDFREGVQAMAERRTPRFTGA